jgi:hypothetical protein
MRSGSPASDGGRWPSAQRPYPKQAPGNRGRHASGARSEPQDGPGPGRRDAPFGPEISWPNGFRQLDPESREVLESAYGTGPVYQQPVVDDYGYGDPGYSDPSYEGPKTPYGNPTFPPGNGNGHGRRGVGGTGRRPSGQGGQRGQRGSGGPGGMGGGQPPITRGGLGGIVPPGESTAYPEQWYDHPQLDDRVLGDSRPVRSVDPRLTGMTHGQLRYDVPEPGEAGYGQPRRGGSDPKTPRGPQMSAGRQQQGPAAPGSGFLSAPVASGPVQSGTASAPVGLLTPPGGTRVDALRAGGARPGTGTVRPGHGLDGPEITSSWPAQPATDLESFEDFWRDDADEEYSGLFGSREAEFERADARQAAARQAASKQAAAKRRTGQRRGGSNDRRLWLGLGGVVVVAAAAIVGIIKYEFPTHSGPAHVMTTPPGIGAYARTVDLEHEADVAALKQKVIAMSAGQASHVVSAVYESGKASAGNTAQIIMFIGGHLANADPAASITSFTQQFTGAQVVGAGAPDSKAACVRDGTGANSVAMCAWFDNDSFGEVVSPTMNASALANAMRTVRPAVEMRAAK